MKVSIINSSNQKAGEKELPIQFNEDYRPDLIKRAVHAVHLNTRQDYGSDPEAGKRASVRISKRRRDYRTSYGYGISRTPRKILSRRGRRMNWVGAFAPFTVGGRRAHPPKSEKIWQVKLNNKERRKAIRSAISATMKIDVVKCRGHIIPAAYPFIIDSSVEKLDKAKQVVAFLKAAGFADELDRLKNKRIRSGKGKMRGRKYARPRGILIVAPKGANIFCAARNIPGLDIVDVKNINAEELAPGANPGRATIWTESSIDRLSKEKLFIN